MDVLAAMPTPSGRAHDEGKQAMNTVLARVQEQVNRVDRSRSLVIGIATGVAALWSLYRVFWLFYSMSVLSGVGYSSGSLVISALFWGAVGIATAAVSAAFLIRYFKHT
jgi:hypothetical protein